jgi:hypothetical protein
MESSMKPKPSMYPANLRAELVRALKAHVRDNPNSATAKALRGEVELRG